MVGMGRAAGPGNGFGARVREIRKARGMPLAALAKRTGVSESAIKNYEGGRHKPLMATTENLAAALRVPIATLFKDVGAPIPAPRRGASPKLLWWIPLAASLLLLSHLCTYCFSDHDNARHHDHDAHLWNEHTYAAVSG